MRIIINTANLQTGGALQRSISFINELSQFGQDEYHIFYTHFVKEQIKHKTFADNFKFYYFENSPAALLTRRKIVKKFNELEKTIKPDIVFSFVGPAYWKPKTVKHLVGFGIPHIVYNDYPYVKKYGLKVKLEMLYKKYWTKHEADYYVVQTQDVKERLERALSISNCKTFVVSNGIGEQYKQVEVKPGNKNDVKKLLLISRYRPSKNFEIICGVIDQLINGPLQFEFHVTIDSKDYERIFSKYTKWVVNHGPVFAKDCPKLYNECDAMFLPAHLECFSASYPEAMKMKRPILTSDLSFAHTVCEDAAIYFDNQNPVDIAKKIEMLFNDADLYQSLIDAGERRLQYFQDSQSQAKSYIDICQAIIN